jgi:hypothetical protein
MIMTHDLNRQCATINMEKYILECIEDFEEEAKEERLELVSTPATIFLFKTRKDPSIELSKGRAGLFHSTVAKLFCC